MSFPDVPEIDRIRERLRAIEQQFEREMRARGFDPNQVDTIALTTPLAKLYNEREELITRLAILGDETNDE